MKPRIKEQIAKIIFLLSDFFGSTWVVLISLCFIALWLISGFFLHFSQNWQNAISIIASLITLIVVFIIQASENRHTKALHLKLNEIIRVLEGARNDLVSVENDSEEKISKLQSEFADLSEIERAKIDK